MSNQSNIYWWIAECEKQRLYIEHLRSDNARLREACEAALEHLDHADMSYANGIVCNGIDEGEIMGGNAHCALTKKLRAAIRKAKGHDK